MVGAPEVLWIGGGDELESGNCDCAMTTVAKVLFGDGTTDDQRVTKTIVGELRVEDCEGYSHGAPGVEFDLPHIRGFEKSISIGCEGDECHSDQSLSFPSPNSDTSSAEPQS